MHPVVRALLQAGEAVWDGYLYKEGDEHTDKTGGWRVNSAIQNTGTNTKNADNLRMVSPSTSGYFASYETTNKIDLTDIDTLYVVWNGSMTSTGFVALTVSTAQNELAGGAAQWFLRQTGTFTDRTDSLDVSGLSGEYYVQLRAQTGGEGQAATMNAYNVYTE